MAGTVKHAKIENRTARARMKRGRQAHWRALVLGRVHLGYQRWPDEAAGRWILRRYIDGKYVVATLGLADDSESANGDRVLSFERAEAQARAALDRPANAHGRLTVRGAVTNYVEFQCAQGKPTGDLLSRSTAHILPPLGDAVVADLTSARLRNWLATLAGMPAMKRSRAGAPQQYKAEPEDDEAIRRRRASANRVLTMLKAALNHAYDEQLVSSNEAWGRRLKPFRDVETARIRYLTIAEAKRLLNACDREFRPLVQAALESGCRYSELTRLQVQDFNVDAGTLNICRSKTGKSRHVVLSEEGTAFFRQTTLGRPGDALMFVRTDGTPLARFASGSARTNRGYVNRPRLAHRCRIRQLLRSTRALKLRPWESPPAWANSEDAKSIVFLEKMLAAGLSQYEPDPMAALAKRK